VVLVEFVGQYGGGITGPINIQQLFDHDYSMMTWSFYLVGRFFIFQGL
jgi:hypothetical protein